MIQINLINVEELIFNQNVFKEKFLEFKHYFDQFERSKHFSFLKNSGTQAKIDLLKNLNKNHIEFIKNFYNEEIEIIKFDNDFCINIDSNIYELSEKIDKINFNYFSIYRNNNDIKLTFFK